jgi:CRISPR/Cas system type I-B associated protein Csh2 (Cas7 group RAMP superfamily)
MEIEDEILVNQLAQEVVEPSTGIAWFNVLTAERQLEALRQIAYMAAQAGANQEDASAAIARSKLRPTYTPCVLLTKGSIKQQSAKITSLPQEEYEKAFRLLIALLGIADSRRRQNPCKYGCSHWWHRDLADPQVVGEIKRQVGSRGWDSHRQGELHA